MLINSISHSNKFSVWIFFSKRSATLFDNTLWPLQAQQGSVNEEAASSNKAGFIIPPLSPFWVLMVSPLSTGDQITFAGANADKATPPLGLHPLPSLPLLPHPSSSTHIAQALTAGLTRPQWRWSLWSTVSCKYPCPVPTSPSAWAHRGPSNGAEIALN